MAALVVIPARFASTRFPGKMLADQTGRPLVQHVVDRVRQCGRVSQVLVAADDARIVDALRAFGTRCVMTGAHHQSGTDRIAEVAAGVADQIIVNVQGDEPEIEPEVVDGLIERLETSTDDMATAATVFPSGADVNDPNLVKVVRTLEGRAIYFSRSSIPHRRDATSQEIPPYFLHLGIYAYRREFLLEFASWEPTPLEQAEKLEQLRALEHGRSIYVQIIKRATHGIDTPQQYEEFVRRMRLG
ncbi:MAG: 3-deoxy-manno-octulosonate cytidylyltransferase [Phycisphaerales bacterium]|nr:3-deoxy-manno-octulosonate cytidylyltransferase [Phycisphaerales bacterium]